MADILDIAKAGEIPNTGVDQALSGAQQGAGLAMAFQKHQQDMQDFQNKQQVFKEQQAGWTNQQLGSILSIANPTLRAAKYAQVQKLAQAQGLGFDPAIATLVKDDSWVAKAQQAWANNNNLPYDQKQAAWQDTQQLMGDAGQFDKSISHAGELQQQRYATNVQAQMQGAQMGREITRTAAETAATASHQVTTDNKENIELIKNANTIMQTAANPELRNDPSSNEEVKQLLSKLTNPGGVIRESEIKEWSHANPGLLQQVQGYIKGKAGMGELTQQQWDAVSQLAQRHANRVQDDVQQQKIASARIYGPLGIDVKNIYSGIPKVYGSDSPAQANAAAPGAPQAPPVKTYTSFSAPQQNALSAKAASLGITLDPKSPQFAQQWSAFQAKLQQRASATAQQPTPAPGGGEQ